MFLRVIAGKNHTVVGLLCVSDFDQIWLIY